MEDVLPFEILPAGAEFQNVDLGDARRNARALSLAESLASAPSKSLPERSGDPAALEAAYRFFSNPNFESEELSLPHIANSWSRAGAAADPWLLSLEDTTEMRFGGNAEREGLGELMNGGQGFYFHTSLLAVMLDPKQAHLKLVGY